MVAVVKVIDDGLPDEVVAAPEKPPRKKPGPKPRPKGGRFVPPETWGPKTRPTHAIPGLIRGRGHRPGEPRATRTSANQQNEVRRQDILDLVLSGAPVRDCLKSVDRSLGWYSNQRKQNPQWALLVDKAREKDRYGPSERPEIDFETFCEVYLGVRVFEHQKPWIALLEGRPVGELHPAVVFEPKDPAYIIINTPPDHAKSTTISVNYVTYLICTNPDARVCVVSKTAQMAAKFCYQVRQRLTHSRYADLQAMFAPPGGYKASADKWTTNEIYLGGEQRAGREGDANLRCIGIGQQIYGSRIDLLVLDDVVVTSNAHEYEKQITWLNLEALTRPGDSGRVVVVGTRVAPNDLYRELRNPQRYTEGESPWTYLAQPAVLEMHEDPDRWVTLWPRAEEPWPGRVELPDKDGLYRRWDGRALKRRRAIVGARTFAFCYQQQDLAEDAVFPAELVRAAVNGMRTPGPILPNQPNCRKEGMHGLYIVGGVDPATAADTGIVVLGLDRFTGVRYLLDARLKTGATPTWFRDTIVELTDNLRVNEWRVEKNGFQKYLVQDPELLRMLADRGCLMSEHFTGSSKWDEAWGIAAMSLLFQQNLVELPSTAKSEAVRQLVEQLITWGPDVDKRHKTDLVMALWFAAIKCQEIMRNSKPDGILSGFLPNRFLSQRRRARQHRVNVTDLAGLLEVG